MKNKYAVPAIIVFVICAVAFLAYLLRLDFFLSMYFEEIFHDKNKNKMQQEEIYLPAGKILAQYCEAVDRKIGLYEGYYFPDIIRQLRPVGGHISPTDAYLQMQGGFYHYGYYLRKEEDSSWTFYYRSDDTGSIQLQNFIMKETPISMEMIAKKVVERYDDEILKRPNNPSWYIGKVLVFIEFGMYDKSLSTCEESLQRFKNNNWLSLTKSVLLLKDNEEKAIQEFIDWVNLYPGYTNYFYLFYLAAKVGDEELAINSIENALMHPLVVTSQDFRNVYYYAALMARYAYENDRQDIVLKVCDAMTDPKREKERKQSGAAPKDFAFLREAVINNRQFIVREWLEDWSEFDLYSGYDIPWL